MKRPSGSLYFHWDGVQTEVKEIRNLGMVLACDSPDTFSGKIPEVSHLPTDASWIFPFKTHAVQRELKAGSLGLSYEALSPHFHHTLLLNQFLSFLLCLPCRYLEIHETGTIWNFIILILEERKKKEKERKEGTWCISLSSQVSRYRRSSRQIRQLCSWVCAPCPYTVCCAKAWQTIR